jgi:hypothetical protein
MNFFTLLAAMVMLIVAYDFFAQWADHIRNDHYHLYISLILLTACCATLYFGLH